MRGFRKDGTALFSDGEPLNSMCDNVLASRLGRVNYAVRNEKFYPDSVDAGLVLLRLLNEAGFDVSEKP